MAGRFAEAEKLYTAILAADPGHVDSLHMFGQLAHQTKRAEAAIRLIGEAIRRKGDVAEFHGSLGIVLAEFRALEEAKQAFERALVLQPDSPEAQTGLGYVYRLLGQVDEAIRRYSAVIAAGVNTADAHNNLGALLFDLNRMDEAVVHGTEALRQNPNLAEAHNNLGNVYRETGRLDEAAAGVSGSAPAQAGLCAGVEQYRQRAEEPGQAHRGHRELPNRDQPQSRIFPSPQQSDHDARLFGRGAARGTGRSGAPVQ